MKTYRESILPAILLFLMISPACRKAEDRITGEIRKISDLFAPDRRTEIFDVRVVESTGDKVILKGETTVAAAKESLLKGLNNQNNNIIDSIFILPDTAFNRNIMGLVTLSVINLRKEPDHSSEMVSQALMGTPVMILKEEDSWMQVRTPDRYISWTESSSVRRVSAEEMREWKNSDRIIFTGNSGWIYSNIAETGITGDVVAGCILARTSESGAYARVILPDGREGFVRSYSIMPFEQFRNKESASGDDIIKRAESLAGVPYLWGGSSAKGVDCSGFVQTVFFMNGLILSRDASQQALYGDSLDISGGFENLLAGDLLFFGSPERISHVAIFEGNGEYIHSSGRVMVNSLDSAQSNYSRYRRNSLVKAMRVLNSPDPGIVPVIDHPWY